MGRNFQSEVIDALRNMLPDCIILKNDANYLQGVPDILVLWGHQWAALECKKNRSDTPEPNQPYYVAKMNQMSFAAFIFPDNVDEVLDDLQLTFRSRRQPRVFER